MKGTAWTQEKLAFCRAYLQAPDVERAAQLAGVEDGYALLRQKECAALSDESAPGRAGRDPEGRCGALFVPPCVFKAQRCGGARLRPRTAAASKTWIWRR